MVDIEAEVRSAGFPGGGQPGGVLVAPNGSSALFYAHEADPATVERLVGWLIRQPWCGALLSSERVERVDPLPGTVPARIAGIDGRRGPDLAMSFAWDSDPNDAGYPGRSACVIGPVGAGTHGGMSAHELRNTLIARGPSFRRSAVIDTPTGNIDVAPTILQILGLSGGEEMDGRVLHEALANNDDPPDVEWETATHTAELDQLPAAGHHHPQLKARRYVDEGNTASCHSPPTPAHRGAYVPVIK